MAESAFLLIEQLARGRVVNAHAVGVAEIQLHQAQLVVWPRPLAITIAVARIALRCGLLRVARHQPANAFRHDAFRYFPPRVEDHAGHIAGKARRRRFRLAHDRTPGAGAQLSIIQADLIGRDVDQQPAAGRWRRQQLPARLAGRHFQPGIGVQRRGINGGQALRWRGWRRCGRLGDASLYYAKWCLMFPIDGYP